MCFNGRREGGRHCGGASVGVFPLDIFFPFLLILSLESWTFEVLRIVYSSTYIWLGRWEQSSILLADRVCPIHWALFYLSFPSVIFLLCYLCWGKEFFPRLMLFLSGSREERKGKGRRRRGLGMWGDGLGLGSRVLEMWRIESM